MKKFFAASLLLPALGSGLFAFGRGQFDFFLTSETLFQGNEAASRRDQFYQTLDLFARYKKWSAGLTLRVNNFYRQDPNVTFEHLKANLYKKHVQYQAAGFSMQLGDFNVLLGRGLVLSVLPSDKLLRERTISGADLQYRRGAATLRLLGGTVSDEIGSQEWRLAASEFLWQYRRSHRLGLHLAWIGDRLPNQRLGDRLTGSLSLAGDILKGGLGYYAEAAFLHFASKEIHDGGAAFAGLTFRQGAWTVMAEAKRYLRFVNELNNPPPADREDELGVLADSAGIRIFLQYAISRPDLLLFFNAGRVAEFGAAGSHFYGGLAGQDLLGKIDFSLACGIRDVIYQVKKMDGNVVCRLSRRLSMELSYREKSYRNEAFRFCERDVLAQISLAPRGSLFFQYQYSAARILERNHFFYGGGRAYFSPSAYIELTAGTIRGGEICAEGLCFYAQPFKGFKASFFATFK